MGLSDTPLQKQTRSISEAIEEMGYEGRKELREELEMNRKEFVDMCDKLYQVANGTLSQFDNIRELELLAWDIHRDAIDKKNDINRREEEED